MPNSALHGPRYKEHADFEEPLVGTPTDDSQSRTVTPDKSGISGSDAVSNIKLRSKKKSKKKEKV